MANKPVPQAQLAEIIKGYRLISNAVGGLSTTDRQQMFKPILEALKDQLFDTWAFKQSLFRAGIDITEVQPFSITTNKGIQS